MHVLGQIECGLPLAPRPQDRFSTPDLAPPAFAFPQAIRSQNVTWLSRRPARAAPAPEQRPAPAHLLLDTGLMKSVPSRLYRMGPMALGAIDFQAITRYVREASNSFPLPCTCHRRSVVPRCVPVGYARRFRFRAPWRLSAVGYDEARQRCRQGANRRCAVPALPADPRSPGNSAERLREGSLVK